MESVWIALALSLKVAGWATAITLVLGVAVGYVLARARFPGRDLLDTLLTLPMVMPPTVLGYYLLVLLGKRSTFGAWLHDSFGINLIFTWQGAVIAASIVAFPLVFKPARAAFEAVDGQLEQAARVLGLSESAVFFRVTLPLAWRGILAGVLLAFARALGEFGATLLVAGRIPRRGPGAGRIRRHAGGRRQYAGQDPTCVHCRLRGGAGRPGRRCQPAGADRLGGLRDHPVDCRAPGTRAHRQPLTEPDHAV